MQFEFLIVFPVNHLINHECQSCRWLISLRDKEKVKLSDVILCCV